MRWRPLRLPTGIELYYHGDHVEFVKDGNPKKPLTPSERQQCDEVVEAISQMARERRQP